jgi:glycosyl transferase, family 25
MNLNDFFPYKVCINLDKRKDRWERMQARFAENQIEQVVRFPAFDGKSLDIPDGWESCPGAYGCLRSHLAVIEEAREQAKPSVLIFEDDAVFDSNFNTRFSNCIKQLPDDWDMVLFGGLHGEPPRQVSNNVMRVTHSLSTYAYALKHTIYDGFIEVNGKAEQLLDEGTRSLQKQFNCYCFMPHLAWVEEDYSDVREENINLWWLRESLVLFGKEMDHILEHTAATVFHKHRNDASLKNINFIARYFAEKLPTVSLLIVDQGGEHALSATELPPNCHVEVLEKPNGSSRNQAFNLGFEMFERSKDFFLFLDSDIFLTREDIRANLLKCIEHDFASSFSEIWNLNEADTTKILNNDLRWNYNNGYERRRKRDVCQSSCFMTNCGVRIIGGWQKTDDEVASLTSTKVRQLLRVYESPNRARRLFNG